MWDYRRWYVRYPMRERINELSYSFSGCEGSMGRVLSLLTLLPVQVGINLRARESLTSDIIEQRRDCFGRILESSTCIYIRPRQLSK